ncbi:MAG: glycosyltransferase family 39 protein [Leptolyngbyaceae cyanobacterium bins.302]|nr:glycosyltransferase family 39 protein [Leptolyngbyaceae cyanobacterium bins.302]
MKNLHWLPDLLIVIGVGLAAMVSDRLWLRLDHTTPAWDAADYLTGSLVHWQALQTPHWFSSSWWTNLWLLSSKIPPLVYISSAPIISVFGKAPDRIMLIFLVYSMVLLGAVYALGTYLFNRRVGLWAVVFCVLMPTLYEARLEYLLDYPLTAMVTLAFLCLTLWWSDEHRKDSPYENSQNAPTDLSPHPPIPPSPLGILRPWLLAIAAGITLGLALMAKQTAGLFLLVPLVWCGLETIWQRAWKRLAQFGVLLLVSVPVWLPWYRTNWLLILTSSKRATIDSAAIQGSPSLLTLDAWTFYLRYLPVMVSIPLLLVPLLGLICFWRRSRLGNRGFRSVEYGLRSQLDRQQAFGSARRSLGWLLLFMLGAYLLSTLNPNKDTRYFAAGLPVLAVMLAYGFTLLPRSWRLVQWGSVALAGLLMLTALFPIFAQAQPSSPLQRQRSFPYQGAVYPLEQVISEVRKTAPYLRSTIGVLPSTPELNQHNVNFFGLVQNFQVYGRQVGTRRVNLTQDRRSLEWFLTKTGDQGAIRTPDLQTAMVQQVEQSGDFELQKSWNLPDSSQLKLYHRQVPSVDVKQLGSADTSTVPSPVQIDRVVVPPNAPPGKAVPVTYQWSGSWQKLQGGLVVLTWKRQGESNQKGRDRWLHDHAIGIGTLYPEQPKPVSVLTPFQVTERLAMFAPADLIPGAYQLEAVYLDRTTGETSPLAVPAVTLQINPTAAPIPAPELDLVSQLRSLAGTLPKGTQSLEQISNEVNRINQYDPVQDYLLQAQQAMTYRLTTEPQNLNYAYTLALATVLKRQVNEAISALQRVTQLDPKNAYVHAYLAFVNLYDFRAGAAQQSLNTALQINPDSPEIQALSGIAALMRGNLMQAWNHAQAYQKADRLRG